MKSSESSESGVPDPRLQSRRLQKRKHLLMVFFQMYSVFSLLLLATLR